MKSRTERNRALLVCVQRVLIYGLCALPDTEKHTKSGGNDQFIFGLSEMQGWRICKFFVRVLSNYTGVGILRLYTVQRSVYPYPHSGGTLQVHEKQGVPWHVGYACVRLSLTYAYDSMHSIRSADVIRIVSTSY